MDRATIDFGIDLGTTNSSIAVLRGTETKVFKNNDGYEYTPSAVWIDSRGHITVGSTAKNRLELDNENAKSEFKLQMGTSQIYTFLASRKQMLPEELSAEVLKSLRGDVKLSTGEDVIAAVISVPAAFELPQTNATRKAAILAGLSVSPLVQEPVAAALTYGFQSKSDRVFWMVYDFGGGTFDVAIVQVRDGQINVVTHGGDNHLGGKLIDYEIVDQLLVPALRKEYELADFNRGNPKWKAAFAKLKQHAEQAKIKLSRDTETDIFVEPLCQDDHGIWVRFEHTIKRSEIEPLLEPFVERSINKCRNVLNQAQLSSGDIEKIILVGGPTLTPIFREILKNKLGIALEFSVDPLTVNAQGAAIFAGTQRLPKDLVQKQHPLLAGQYNVDLEYEAIGTELEPLVGGVISLPDGKLLPGFTIEFVQSKTLWRSGKINLSNDGKFVTNLLAIEGANEFLIELKDGTGNICQISPAHFTYTYGLTISGQPLINTVGIALANNLTLSFFEKGMPLPIHHREILHTAVVLKKGISETNLKIPVIEGENKRADRNSLIGALEIRGDQVKRDVPLGSEVEVTIDIDESRILKTRALIRILDEEFANVLKYDYTHVDLQKLADEFKREKFRLQKVKEQAQRAGITKPIKALVRIDDEHMIHDVESTLAAAPIDAGSASACQKRLLDLEIAIDEAENILKLPALISEAQANIKSAKEIVNQFGKENDKTEFNILERETQSAIADEDADLLRQKADQLNNLEWRIRFNLPGTWVGLLQYLEGKRSEMTTKDLADRLFAQGHRAIDTNDINGLKIAVRQLYTLFPEAPPAWLGGYEGGLQQ